MTDDGWPGVFRPLRHFVPAGATRLLCDGGWVYFAVCNSPCWPPTAATVALPWCGECLLAAAQVFDGDPGGTADGRVDGRLGIVPGRARPSRRMAATMWVAETS